jgi:hypothetical protein
MKSVALVIGIFLSVSAFAAEQQLSLKIKPDGQPSFGIQYAYDIDATWTFNYDTTISSQTLAALPNTIFWSLINVNTNQLLSDWIEIDKTQLAKATINISSKSILANVLPNLNWAKTVYGVKNAQGGVDILFSIPIGPLCQIYANHFMDLTKPSRAACTVTAADIPDWASECKNLEKTFLDYVKRGLLTCNIAKAQYAKRECGTLACQ